MDVKVLFYGDNLDQRRSLPDGAVDLVDLDTPMTTLQEDG